MSMWVGILPMILRWGCGVPVAATSRESYALAMSIGRNTGLVGSGKGVKGPALTSDRGRVKVMPDWNLKFVYDVEIGLDSEKAPGLDRGLF